ncbi:MAG: DUF1707 SHOCT-like domain-containing protein [Streptosporangiaceae bacterium]
MSHMHIEDGTPVRASAAEREQAAEMLRAGYAEGRLTSAELDERLDAVYAAETRAGLRGLTRDLPGAAAAPSASGRPLPASLPVLYPEPGAGTRPDWCLLLCLLLAFPPAGIAYWMLTARRQAQAAVPDRSPLPGASAG